MPQNILYGLPDGLASSSGHDRGGVDRRARGQPHAACRWATPPSSWAAGMIGQLTVQAAKVGGLRRVFAVDIDDAKLAMARKTSARTNFQLEERVTCRRRSRRGPADTAPMRPRSRRRDRPDRTAIAWCARAAR